MLLPPVLEFTKNSAIERLAVIGRLLRPDLETLSDGEIADVVVEEIKKLCNDLKIPNMKTYGIDKEKFGQVVSKMAADALASGSPGNNPRVPSLEEIVDLYHTCFDYDFTVKETAAIHQ